MRVNEEIHVRIEKPSDFKMVALLASHSFGHGGERLTASYLEWLYRQGFGGETDIISAYCSNRKIGHAACLWHPIRAQGRLRMCAQLVDLFVSPEHRSFAVISRMYRAIRELLQQQKCEVVVTVPNARSNRLNERFLGLKPQMELSVRVGIANPIGSGHGTLTRAFDPSRTEQAISLLSRTHQEVQYVGVDWQPERLAERLSNPNFRYAIHAADTLLAITSPRVFRGIRTFLVCAVLPCRNGALDKRDLAGVLRSAAQFHHNPVFVYVGINDALPFLPGYRLPRGLRPSPMSVQVADRDTATSHAFTRFEALDFDFA